jgi:hypothetical protein
LNFLDDIERPGEKAIGEGIVDEVRRNLEDVRLARALDAVALEGAEVIDVPELATQAFEDFEISLLSFGAERSIEVSLEIGDDMVVVEKGIVDVEEEDDATHGYCIAVTLSASGGTEQAVLVQRYSGYAKTDS